MTHWDGSSDWERGTSVGVGIPSVAESEPFNPEYAEAPQRDEWDEDRRRALAEPAPWQMGPGQVIELPPDSLFVVIGSDYETREIAAVFSDEDEADRYAKARNEIKSDWLEYEVETFDNGWPRCGYAGPVWEVRWSEQYNVGSEIQLKDGWHEGTDPGDCQTVTITPQHFHLRGKDRDQVVHVAKRLAAERERAFWTKQRIQAEKKISQTRFRIDSPHEFG